MDFLNAEYDEMGEIYESIIEAVKNGTATDTDIQGLPEDLRPPNISSLSSPAASWSLPPPSSLSLSLSAFRSPSPSPPPSGLEDAGIEMAEDVSEPSSLDLARDFYGVQWGCGGCERYYNGRTHCVLCHRRWEDLRNRDEGYGWRHFILFRDKKRVKNGGFRYGRSRLEREMLVQDVEYEEAAAEEGGLNECVVEDGDDEEETGDGMDGERKRMRPQKFRLPRLTREPNLGTVRGTWLIRMGGNVRSRVSNRSRRMACPTCRLEFDTVDLRLNSILWPPDDRRGGLRSVDQEVAELQRRKLMDGPNGGGDRDTTAAASITHAAK
ncbi:uncharacterized protein BDR25DRAFT_340977 [Lindgomyces ingoldianus]|uniref:Uncharacterized protein n=1 Tax=Lindgomyces ingoldianus TaxID=673940 RepID=A0ACB6R334_9PLEO|nr:uncharacterized protein BDR25DRAFT_340977 [Lindgomyces ingoldianus]KAF2473654.1 hypothetical protein BDR25DRAFT_340977 [Lindgomyces ingoldianus]